MTVIARNALLKQIESFSYDARVAWMSKLGRDAAATPALAKVIQELLAGDAYEASLALDAAAAARHPEAILQALDHPSVHLRRKAARLAGRFVHDIKAIEHALLHAALDIRRTLLRSLALQGPHKLPLAQALFPTVHAHWGAHEATLLLPALPSQEVSRLLPDLIHAMPSHRRLAKTHPDPFLAYLKSELMRLPESERTTLWQRYRSAISDLAQSRSLDVLTLSIDFGPPDTLAPGISSHLGRFVRRHPLEVMRLLTATPNSRKRLVTTGLPRGVLQNLDALAQNHLLEIARLLAERPEHLAAVLAHLPPSRRADVFSHAYRPDELQGRLLPQSLLDVLPHALRDREAARMLSVREVQSDPDKTLQMMACRSIDHARPVLEPKTRASKAEDRALALSLLIRSTRLYKQGLTETLQTLERIKNEQDPVRLAAFAALADIPASHYQDAHVAPLAALADHVVQARDTSPGTRSYVQRIAIRFIRHHASNPTGALFLLGLQLLQKLTRQAGALSLPLLERDLSPTMASRLVDALAPMIHAAQERESHQLVLALGRALGRRGHQINLLQSLLEPVTRAKPDYLAQQAILLWVAPPKTRNTRIRQLLDQDPSTISLFPIFYHVHRKRQDWLDPFIDGTPIRGRFLTGQTIYVLPAVNGFHRWLPRQQSTFAKVLHRVASDGKRNHRERARGLMAIGHLLTAQTTDLEPYLASKEIPIIEAALGALAWLDRPTGAIQLLLRFIDGDRARVAMYAIPRCARFVSTPLLVDELANILAKEGAKITVQKEAIRLLGAFPSQAGTRLIESLAAQPKIHRDVHIALGHATRKLLDVPAFRKLSWNLLERLSVSSDPYVAQSLLDQRPFDLSADLRASYVALLLKVAAHPDVKVRRAAFLALCSWSSHDEQAIAQAAASRLTDIDGGVEWREALSALITAVRDGKAFDHLTNALQRLKLAPVKPDHDATRERDRPMRQRLIEAVARLVALSGQNRLRLAPSLHQLALLLATDPTLLPESFRLCIAIVPWLDQAESANQLQRLALDADSDPVLVEQLSAMVTATLLDTTTLWEPEKALVLVDRLTLSHASARLAVAILAVVGPRLAFRDDFAERLRALRRHPMLSVQMAALAIVTAAE